MVEKRINDYPLDYYLDYERIKNKQKPMFVKERAEQELEAQPSSRTEKLIKQINALAIEAEEKVKACIYNKAARPSSVFSPVSLDESDSGYTEHLVEAKFNEVTFQKPKETEWKSQKEIRKEPLIQSRKLHINKLNNKPAKNGRETFRSTAETVSIMAPKQINKNKSNPKSDSPKQNPQYVPKSPSIINPENRHFREEFSEAIYTKTTCHYCSCDKETGIESHLKHSKDNLQKNQCEHKGSKLLIDSEGEQTSRKYKEKQYSNASVNTDPLLLRTNTNLVSVVSSREEKSSKVNDYGRKLCQIQELPLVVIRPNFTKQVGPVIDIKTTMPSSPKNNVAVVECIHGRTTVEPKENTSLNIVREYGIDSASQTVSPPAVHFKNSRDLKLLKVTKDLLGKLNFKDGANVEKLKRSLTSLVTLLNQISPIHVANLRLSNLDAGSASESIDTFFSNIDLVTEIIENEIKKPTGRYCDYPECLIKAVDLLCGNIRSVFVIEDFRKKSSKPSATSGPPGEEKTKDKKTSACRGRKQSRKTTVVSKKSSSAISSNDIPETEENMVGENKGNVPGNLYIPYRLLIPGGKHKAMEEAKNSQDIELRFKRLEKILEINENLKKSVPSNEFSQTDNSSHSLIDEEKSMPNKNAHVLNETFVISSSTDDDGENENEIIQEKDESKVNKTDQDYEDDWEEVDSTKSYDGSMSMTEINVVAQVHSSGRQSSIAHSSPKKQSHELSVSSKGSQTGNLVSVSDLSSRESQNPSKENEIKETKRQTGRILNKQKVHSELKDVETQYYVGKRDISTMYCDDLNQSQKPKIDTIEPIVPITIPPETGSFTVLRMTNASTNSLLEVRFPEQTEKLQSSLTVQKTHNSEEVKLLYNLDKEEKIISLHENGFKSIPSRKGVEILEPIKIDAPKNIEKVLTKCEQNIDDISSLQKKEEINDFQHITTNFIQFLESKVTEMVNKFKTSEVTCEKLLDQKLTCRDVYKPSANNAHISSSKTSLKNEVFYKSASSLISTQSNDDFGNWLSRRCTPDNQEIVPFENLTSPPVGLQLKDASTAMDISELQNIDRKPNIEEIKNSNLFGIPLNLEREKEISDGRVLDKFDNDSTSDKIMRNIKLVLKEKENKEMPKVNGLHNRLLPLPEDVNYNRSSGSSAEKEKASSSASLLKVTAEIHRAEEYNDRKNTSIQQIIETSTLNSNGTATVQEVDISQKTLAGFEEAISALTSVEHSLDITESNEESTVIVAKTPTIGSKSEDELDSLGTSVTHFANILSASESGITSNYPVPKYSDSKMSFQSKIIHHEPKSKQSSEVISIEKDFSRLFPIPEQIEKNQSEIKFADTESQAVSKASVHSLFVSGPSHIDRSLKSSDFLSNKTDNSSVLRQEIESSSTVPEISSQTSTCGSVESLAFNNRSLSTNQNKSIATGSVSLKHDTQLSPPPQTNTVVEKKQFDNFSQTTPPIENIVEAQAVYKVSMHSLFVSDSSHVDRSSKPSDTLSKKTVNSSVLTNEIESSSTVPEILSPTSSCGSNESLGFNNQSLLSNQAKSTATGSVSLKRTQLSPPPQTSTVAEKKQFNNFSQTTPPKENIVEAPSSSIEEVSEISDDFLKLNYFNPEEMSDGEVGYVCTFNSYSSGEIKPYNERNEDDILTELSTVQEMQHHFESALNLDGGETNILNTISETKEIMKSSVTETGTTHMDGVHKKYTESGPAKYEKNQDNFSLGDLLNSSNDSTSTGELKKLFNKDDKIDEEKLIDIQIHCNTRFSSESSGRAESVESREENI